MARTKKEPERYIFRETAEERNENFLKSDWLIAVELLLTVFEVALSYAKKLHEMHELSRESMKEIETKLQEVFKQLEMATYEVALDLRKPVHSQHPLKLLWNRWDKCKKQVEEMVEWFLQK